MDKSIWVEKGATLSHKNAMKEYKLSEDELEKALQEGKLQYKINYVHGNPYYKLIRKEVEALLKEKGGEKHLEKIKLETRISQVDSEIRKHKRQIKKLEKEKGIVSTNLEKL